MPRPASSFLNISTISVRCSMAVPTGRDAGRLRRSGYTGPMVAHPQSPARVPRTHQSGILPRPHYGVHNVRLTFARPSLDLRSRRQPPFDTIWACFPVSSDGIIKQKHLSWR